MFELTINGVVYQFHFGMGFMREVNKKVTAPVPNSPGVTKPVGLNYAVAGIMDGDVEALVDVLDVANKGQNPRASRAVLDSYIDNESTDLDALFADVLDFLSRANATKKTVAALKELAEEQKRKDQMEQ